MPDISVRFTNARLTYSKISTVVRKYIAQGVKVYHLNIGQPDLESPKAALDAIRAIDLKVLEYSPSDGYSWYRENLVKYYAAYNIDVKASDIVIITTGGSKQYCLLLWHVLIRVTKS